MFPTFAPASELTAKKRQIRPLLDLTFGSALSILYGQANPLDEINSKI